MLVHSLSPRHFSNYWPCRYKLTRDAIQHKGIAPLIDVQQELASLSPNWQVQQHAFIGRIEIPDVVRNLLVIPFQFPGVRIESHNAIRVKIVAGTIRAVEIGRGISNAPIN